MSSTIPNADVFNWVIGPASQCVLLVGEETKIASLLQRAVITLANSGSLLELARQQISRAKMPETAIKRLLMEQEGLTSWAKELMSDDFHAINVHGVIGLWVAVEVAVEDTAVLILMKEPSAVDLIAGTGVRLPNVDGHVPSEADARRIYDRLERHSRQGRLVIEGYQYLLQTLRVSVVVPNTVALVLSELNYIRNCLLHRAGIVDQRVTIEAPDLDARPGEQVKLSSTRYLHYFDAVSQFALALLKGTIESPYVRSRAQRTR